MPEVITARLTHDQDSTRPYKSPRRTKERICLPRLRRGHLVLFGTDSFFCWTDESDSHLTAVAKRLHGLIDNRDKHFPKVMPKPSTNGSHPAEAPDYEGYTVSQYAADKKLSLPWLVMNYTPDLRVPTPMQGTYLGKPYVKFAYMTEDREVVFTRRRYSADSKPRSEYGSVMSVPYGLWLWTNKADKKGHWPRCVVICEGESDQQTLTLHSIPAIGIPGVNNWKSEWAKLPIFKYADKILVVQEPPKEGKADVGKKFVAGSGE